MLTVTPMDLDEIDRRTELLEQAVAEIERRSQVMARAMRLHYSEALRKRESDDVERIDE